ncbi:MAG: tRNA uridine-5-carboxymethylaminomethyl(34) synthesis GTPase MnmE [Anaerovoracaceae bacterium]
MDGTIAAIATAYGEGGIGIVRISGEKAASILRRIFIPQKTGSIVDHRLTYGFVIDPENNEKIDEVLAVYMGAPNTYTAEDVVEINCHGSMIALRKTLALVLREGADMAEPGEFTKRAFLNGRLDLSQAEAVIDVIKAKSDKGYNVALDQLAGKLSERVKDIRQKILDILVNLAVNIDYPDEDIEEVTYDQLEKDINKIKELITELLSTAKTGRVIKEGLNVAIIGKPNVGKSSLMNEMLQENRAIVTEIPGTTRDTIEEIINIKNIPVKLTDTAGIRDTKNQIEKIGIEKSKHSFNKADLVIFVLDSNKALTKEDIEIIEYLKEKKSLVLMNKIDLDQQLTEEEIKSYLPKAKIIKTSMVKGEGILQIEDEIEKMVYGGKVKQSESLLVTNVRHEELLNESQAALEDALNMTISKAALDFIEIDVKNSYELLGEIIGETVSDDIIHQVFARFCLGK